MTTLVASKTGVVPWTQRILRGQQKGTALAPSIWRRVPAMEHALGKRKRRPASVRKERQTRGVATRSVPPAEPKAGPSGSQGTTEEHQQHQLAMRRALNAITREQLLVCVWRKAGFSNAEIAQHLGCSPDAVDEMFDVAMAAVRRAFDN